MKMNPTDNPIVINCKSADLLSLDKIVEFQGKLKKLTEANRNKLINSICIEGFIAPLFLWDDTGEYKVLDGHQRVKTLIWMRENGWDIPALPVDYIEAKNEKDARGKLLKITSQYGDFDLDELNFWLDDLDEDIIESIRLVNDEIDIVINSGMDEVETIADDEIPEVVETVTKLGDLWELGNHRLLCGDSTDLETVKKLMDNQRADMVFTDPPYNGKMGVPDFKQNTGLNDRTLKMKESVKEIYTFDPVKTLPIIEYFKKEKISSYFFCNKNLIPKYINYALENKKKFFILLWHKPNYIPLSSNHYFPDTEYIIKIQDSGALFNTGLSKDKLTYNTYWVMESLKGDKKEGIDHPTIKPQKIITECLYVSSAVNSIVLDLFLGSGSTLIASEKTNRICYAMEIEPYYCDITVNRYINWCSKNDREPVVKLNGEEWNAAR